MNYENNKHDFFMNKSNDFNYISLNDKKKKNKQELEEAYQKKHNDINDFNIINYNNKNNTIVKEKLKKILSKKYNLTDKQYILIIDKFKLNSNKLNRNDIQELILYLKDMYKFNDYDSFSKTESNNIVYNKNIENKTNIQNNNLNNQVVNNLLVKPLSDEKSLTKNEFDKYLLKIQNERKDLFKEDISQTENIINNKNNISLQISEYNNDIQDIQDIDKLDKDNNNSITQQIRDNVLNINQSLRDNFDIKSDSKVNTYTSINKNISKVIMFNILKDEINGDFFTKINYNGVNFINNIIKVEFVGCFMNKNFCEKNEMHKTPSIIIRIEEFDNNFYINGGKISGFCQCILNKNNNVYLYNHRDNIYGNYEPETPFTLEQLSIQLLDINGKKIDKLSYNENDTLNIILKITLLV